MAVDGLEPLAALRGGGEEVGIGALGQVVSQGRVRRRAVVEMGAVQ